MLRDLARSTVRAARGAMVDLVYRRVLQRGANADELAHWKVFVASGATLQQLERTLRASFEYAQLTNAHDVTLVTLEGFKLFCRTSDLDVGRQIIRTKTYEPHVTAMLKKVLKPGHCFCDVGANIGYFALLASSLVGEAGTVLAFEPSPSNAALLLASVVESNRKNVRVFPLAASHEASIFKIQSFGSNGFLAPATPGDVGAVYAQAMPIDGLLESLPPVDVVKLDIEGFEPLAIEGMERMLKRRRPTILTEMSPWHLRHRCGVEPEAYLARLTALGYRVSIIEPSGAASSPSTDIMAAWRAANSETKHFDLVAVPG